MAHLQDGSNKYYFQKVCFFLRISYVRKEAFSEVLWIFRGFSDQIINKEKPLNQSARQEFS